MLDANRSPSRLIWIDLDNSPHVPFFQPIIQELESKGCRLLLTARDAYQVTELVRLHRIDCITVGRHFGRYKLMKGIGLMVRALQLLPLVTSRHPALAVSHGSRAQILVAKLLGIPSVVLADYEHVRHVTRPDWLIVPDVMPIDSARKFADGVLTYPGIKEDVYTSMLSPNPAILSMLGISAQEVVVTVRPPATEAHYHSQDSDVLFEATMELLATHPRTRIVLLPRNQGQASEIRRRWSDLLETQKLIVPAEAVDGLNLVWHSDLVISGGGTMNREAAALGVPVYSIFRGNIGAVDRHLAERGRLVLIETIADVRQRIKLVKHSRPSDQQTFNRITLDSIVNDILSIASGRKAHELAT